MSTIPQGDMEDRYKDLVKTVRLHVDGEDALRADVLLTFPYEYPGCEAEVLIETEEFTALCPWTGLPDFGTLTVRYVPDKVCIELKSLKYYLMTFRAVGILQEHAANRLLVDLVRAVGPKRMTVTLDYRIRGGLHTVVTVSHP